jgi:glycosyltransferase involved in cell wall biosynthesis
LIKKRTTNSLIILQTVVPDYRKKLFSNIKTQLGSNFKIYGGNYYFEKTVKTDSSIPFISSVRNVYIFNRKLLFQFGVWHFINSRNVLVLELNPRIISNWIILLIRKISRSKTVLWGHAWPRSGPHNSSDKIRGLMRNLGDEIIVYTETQKLELENKMPRKIIKTAPNAVYYSYEMITSQNAETICDIIYVGRLTKSTKPLFLIKAFHNAIIDLPECVTLIIIGEGDEKSNIMDYVHDNGLSSRVKILGHIGEYNILKELYASSLFSVSPGYVGLSITQSFGFGVPMLISKNENHSPEIEATIENENSLYFESDNINDLSVQILNVFSNKPYWLSKRESIVKFCKEKYSIEVMSKTFIDLLES